MVTGLLGGLVLLGLCTAAAAQPMARVASDETAGYVVFPKIIVDTTGQFYGGLRADTVVQLTNMSDELIRVNCWYVSGNRVCDNNPDRICQLNSDCDLPGICQPPTCAADDFQLTLTPRQPLAWRVSDPPDFLPCDPTNPDPGAQACVTDNEAAAIPLTEDPFQGELKCVQVDESEIPVDRNDLKGEATIYLINNEAIPPIADTASYNAIGIQAVTGGDTGDNRLSLDGSEYAGCPAVLILNNVFEGAQSPFNQANTIRTQLTLVPCSEDLSGVVPPVTTAAQMLIYNEFEQRFSTSKRVSCFDNLWLGDVDTRPGEADNQYSIFAIGTQGTLTGQTRIRGVETAGDGLGHGLLGVAQEVHDGLGIGTAAFNLNYFGDRRQADTVQLSVPAP